MLSACTELKNAESVKQYLVRRNLLNTDYGLVKELGLIYFPILKKTAVPRATVINTRFSFPEKKKSPSFEDLLKRKLTSSEFELLPHTQEMVGKILILEIPEELKKKEKLLAQAYLQHQPYLETVVCKSGIHSGTFRIRKVKILAGKRTKETIHHENGIRLKLHLEKTYFSARSANERLRISKLVKPAEKVLVMFSGAAPFPLVIAKNSEAKIIFGVEINPLAHQYALENVSLNNLGDKITLFEGDVRKIVPSFEVKFDRIAMPLPKTGEQFLGLALSKIKKGGMIHFYSFLNENEIFAEKKKIKEIASLSGHSLKIVRVVKCGQFSPGTFRICFDLKVLK